MQASSLNRRVAADAARRRAKLDALPRRCISLMSDTKWLKTLRALSAIEGEIARLEWKFIDEARTYPTSVPRTSDLAATRLKDGSFQPFAYREIEWIEVVTNDVTAVRDALASCGQRLIEASTAGVRVVGYRRESRSTPGPK